MGEADILQLHLLLEQKRNPLCLNAFSVHMQGKAIIFLNLKFESSFLEL